MHDTTFVLTILALFTSRENAAEIEGDLLEQSRRHGRGWFWWQVGQTSLALFLHRLRQEGGRLLLFSYAVYELALKLNWWGLNPLRRALRSKLALEAPQMLMMNHAITFLSALALGVLLARLSPKQGGQIALLASGLLLGRVALLSGVSAAVPFVPFAFVPALAGALLVKWLELRGSAQNAAG
jgi:hypothetical protein